MRNTMPDRRSLLRWGTALGAAPLADMVLAQGATPAEVLSHLPQARAAGAARMRFFGLSIYDARLWVSPGFDANRYAALPFALELRYLRTLDGTAIAKRSIEEMRRGGPIDDGLAQQWQAGMEAAFPDVKEGDRIIGLHQPGSGARFFFNGQLRSALADAAFSERFFGIWLAPWTSEPQLRSALLAGAQS